MAKAADHDRVATFMTALAVGDDREHPLPDPHGIFRRARLRERLATEQAKADRAARPVVLAGVLGPFAVAVVLSTLLAARGPAAAVVAILWCAVASSLAVRLALIEE